jgi:hypothetical protein
MFGVGSLVGKEAMERSLSVVRITIGALGTYEVLLAYENACKSDRVETSRTILVCWPPLAEAFHCAFLAISTSASVIHNMPAISNGPVHAKVSRAL